MSVRDMSGDIFQQGSDNNSALALRILPLKFVSSHVTENKLVKRAVKERKFWLSSDVPGYPGNCIARDPKEVFKNLLEQALSNPCLEEQVVELPQRVVNVKNYLVGMGFDAFPRTSSITSTMFIATLLSALRFCRNPSLMRICFAGDFKESDAFTLQYTVESLSKFLYENDIHPESYICCLNDEINNI